MAAAQMMALLLALTSASYLATGQQLEGPYSCGTHEVWNPKCNAHCEPTCLEGDRVLCSRSGGGGGGPRKGQDDEPFSERICRPKCTCIKGYIRETRDGPCVPRTACGGSNTKCKRNESFDSCGSSCPAICGRSPPLVCTANCVPGCFCSKGFIRDINGLCIPHAACRHGSGQRPPLSPPLPQRPFF